MIGNNENAIKYLGKAIELDAEVKELAGNTNMFDSIKESKEFQDLIK